MSFSDLTEEELINRILESDKDSKIRNQLFEELWKRYEKDVYIKLIKLRRYAPKSYDRKYFLEEGKQLVAEKLLLSIDTYQKLGSFEHWLGIVIRSVVIDLYRKENPREEFEMPLAYYRIPRKEGNKEETDEEATDRISLQFKSEYFIDPEGWYGDPEKWLEIEERKRIIKSALFMHAQRDPKSAKAIRKHFWEGRSETEMSSFFCRSKRQIWRWLQENLIKLRMIFALNFRITQFSDI